MPDIAEKLKGVMKFLFTGKMPERYAGWAEVPEGYSPKKTIKSALKFTFLGERDPRKLYNKL